MKTIVSTGGVPALLISYIGGLGDELLCTAVAHELRKRGASRPWLLTTAGEIFALNLDVIPVPFDFRQASLLKYIGAEHRKLKYPDNPSRHIISEICAGAGIDGEIALRPYVVLSEQERARGLRSGRRQIAIQSSNLSARYGMKNKQWFPSRFQRIVDLMNDEFDFVQLGLEIDPPLHGCIDLRGRTTFREAAAVLASSKLFIGLVGGLMHLARAVDCRSVIVFGGREHPDQSGYVANENIHWTGPCSPCWLTDECSFDRVCMSEIEVDTVLAAARRQLAIGAAPLAVGYDHIAPTQ